MTDSITLIAPDDWHIHLRDGDALPFTVNHVAKNAERAIIMPNLVPPVLNAEQALAYKARIQAHIPKGEKFEPLMVLYLTDKTSPEDIIEAKKSGVVACKLYPAGATTNSDSGVTDIQLLGDTFKTMEQQGIKLLIHGEVTQSDVDIFDREAAFLNEVLPKITNLCPNLSIVLEHITTKEAVEFVKQAPANIAATITAHHLLYNRNHMLAGGIKPHYYCLPILKRNVHQEALIEAATSGNPKFFAGTDSAPHAKSHKESACGCAGSYTAFALLELYAEAFDKAGAMDKLEGFASLFGADFYGLARNTETVTLRRDSWTVPETFDYLDETIVPICAGEALTWSRQNN